MIRVLFYVAIVFALAIGFAWLADRPGAIDLTWQGYHIETSLLFAAIAVAVVVAAITLVGAILRAFVHTPKAVGGFFAARRRDRGYKALSRGMIAVGAGDVRLARVAADEAAGLLGSEPLTLLLTAQAAQLADDRQGARNAFEALALRPETRVLGLHGLFVEARRQGEDEAARHFAEEATRAAPRIAWAGTALFEYQAEAGDWIAALRTLGANTDAKVVDRKTARRLRAVLLTAWALESEGGEPEEARVRALEAHRLAPELTEAAVVAGRLQARAGDIRRAARTLEAAWKAMPHPEIAEAYVAIRSGDSVRDRLKRMRRLADLRPNHPESAMALARAAIDAHDWPAARAALEDLVRARPSERVCLLMAELEEGEHGDEGRVRSWLARAIHAPRDPSWVADGQVFPRWRPISPVSGRVDAFEWKVAGEPLPGARLQALEAAPDRPPPTVAEPAATDAGRAPEAEIVAPGRFLTTRANAGEAPPGQDHQEPEPHDEEAEDRSEPAPPTGAEPAIPRVPDDPGPDPAAEEATAKRFRLF